MDVTKLAALESDARPDEVGSNVASIGSEAKHQKSATAATNGRNRVRRETGKEQMVQVHYDEGVAIHIGPEFMRGRS